jgi:hypothetical protein
MTFPRNIKLSPSLSRILFPKPVRKLQTSKELAAAIANQQLPNSSVLGKTAMKLDGELRDNQMSNFGKARACAGQLKSFANLSDAAVESWAFQLACAFAKENCSAQVDRASVKTLTPEAGLNEAGIIIAKGNAYGDEEIPEVINGMPDEDPPRLGLSALTKTLGAPCKCVVVDGVLSDDRSGRVGMAVFLNTTTGQFAAFFGREST